MLSSKRQRLYKFDKILILISIFLNLNGLYTQGSEKKWDWFKLDHVAKTACTSRLVPDRGY